MFLVRKDIERGYVDQGWLKTRHTFSFGSYFDRHNMAFRNLRVINEDRFAAGHGFDMHPHKDMEILTYVISGTLKHIDSMGNGSIIQAGELQYMSAGSGILHSEKNPSYNQECHLLQIWIMPRSAGGLPAYGQSRLEGVAWQRIAAPDHDAERGGAIGIRADVNLYVGKFSGDALQDVALRHGFGWVQVIYGGIKIQGTADSSGTFSKEQLAPGDGLAISGESRITINVGGEGAEFLLFDLP